MAFAFAAGLVVIVAMVPLNAALAKRIGAATRELMGHKDDRVQRCSEMLHGIRVSAEVARKLENLTKMRLKFPLNNINKNELPSRNICSSVVDPTVKPSQSPTILDGGDEIRN